MQFIILWELCFLGSVEAHNIMILIYFFFFLNYEFRRCVSLSLTNPKARFCFALLLCRLVAYALNRLGLDRGSTVAIDMPMNVKSVVIYLAIVLAGYVVVSIADSFAPLEIATRLKISEAKAIFTQVVIYFLMLKYEASVVKIFSIIFGLLDIKVNKFRISYLFFYFISEQTAENLAFLVYEYAEE